MIFHEIYGRYFHTVSQILSLAVAGSLTDDDMARLCRESAFSESFLEILPALKSERWPFLDSNLKTPLKYEPKVPLTTLQKQWLKGISLDPRIQLFSVNTEFLNDVPPLFTKKDFVEFDVYHDGDPYDNPTYQRIFRMLLWGIRERKGLEIFYTSGKGNRRKIQCVPWKLEYSAKDDKFRVLISGSRYANVLNVSRIKDCRESERVFPCKVEVIKKPLKHFTMELEDQRNTLERAFLHFAHFEKEAERISNHRYWMKVFYEEDDETELVIRVLSFGPFIKVKEPEALVQLIKQRLKMQKSCQL